MTPLEFLKEEFKNVSALLNETLKREYEPEGRFDYFQECKRRLRGLEASIKDTSERDLKKISRTLVELSGTAEWIALIERSHLGEFSWPFAEAIREIAKNLLSTTGLDQKLDEPIIHVISSGRGYQIHNDKEILETHTLRRISVVEFPRSDKHQVLMHSLFGHELCHTAIIAPTFKSQMEISLLNHLSSEGKMKDEISATNWLTHEDSPSEIRDAIAEYKSSSGKDYVFPKSHWKKWRTEFACDIFGIVLFGPSFLAAHQTFLKSRCLAKAASYLPHQTHPLYSSRHKTLVQVMRLMGWNIPITSSENGQIRAAEVKFLDQICHDDYADWDAPFTDSQLKKAVEETQVLLQSQNVSFYTKPCPSVLNKLVQRLSSGQPPIICEIDSSGAPQLTDLSIYDVLYAGWVFWESNNTLTKIGSIDFHSVNRLCDHALLQQRAITIAKKANI